MKEAEINIKCALLQCVHFKKGILVEYAATPPKLRSKFLFKMKD